MASKLGAFFGGLNPYKWGAIIAIGIATHIGAYAYGVHNTKMDYAEDAAEQAKERAALIVDNVNARLPEVREQDTQAAELAAQMRLLRGDLNEAISKRVDSPECALSDDELRYFQEAARRTR